MTESRLWLLCDARAAHRQGRAGLDRRRHERGIVASYHRALVTAGVGDYTLDNCWDDYVGNLIQAPLIIVFGSAAAQPTERGNAMFDAMLSRSAAAIDDLAPGGL